MSAHTLAVGQAATMPASHLLTLCHQVAHTLDGEEPDGMVLAPVDSEDSVVVLGDLVAALEVGLLLEAKVHLVVDSVHGEETQLGALVHSQHGGEAALAQTATGLVGLLVAG